jgi:hypothetical protein
MTDDLVEEGRPWVVVIGNFSDGFDIFGPFETWDAASEWADAKIDVARFVLLQKPTTRDAEEAA